MFYMSYAMMVCSWPLDQNRIMQCAVLELALVQMILATGTRNRKAMNTHRDRTTACEGSPLALTQSAWRVGIPVLALVLARVST